MTKIKQILSYIVLAITIFVALGTLAAAHAGSISPIDSKIAPLLCMTFPYWVIASLAVIVISYFVKKRYSLIPLMALVICWKSILLICPVNLFSSHNSNGSNSFTLLCYNAYNFRVYDNNHPEDDSNATLNYIAATDADIVAVCDKDEFWLNKAKEKLGDSVAYYTSFDEFIAHPMEAVLLANYFHEHAPFAIKCFQKNIHVFCECISNGTLAEGV